MQKRISSAQIIAIITIACLLMAFVDTVWQPGYIIKSSIKIALFLLLPLAYSKIKNGVSYKYLFKFDWKHFGISIGMGLAVFAFILAAYKILGPFFDFSSVTKSMEKEAGITRDNFLFIAVYISFVNALLEEFFFRGFAYLELKKWTSRGTALTVSAGAFALYHISIMLSWFTIPLFILLLTGLFIGGVIFNLLNEHSNNIYSSWMVHMFSNFAINTVGLLLFKG
ncbi:MAG TPA: CPBP family intramembrane metalloprotease [Clostridiales bacterium UBA8960]|nr:CPBP family intramembrane metalloprotease [Clostridiales bacterium UBA8960]